MEVEAKLEEFGLVLPERLEVSPGLRLPFSWVRVRGRKAYVSGHGALNPDGSVARPLGTVGRGASRAALRGSPVDRFGHPRKPQARAR